MLDRSYRPFTRTYTLPSIISCAYSGIHNPLPSNMDISPVLHTHDVLSIIFHHLRPVIEACPLSGDIVDQRRALVALSVTSKLLSEYALDSLWKCLTYERPLLVLLEALRSTNKLPKSPPQGGGDLAASVPFLVSPYSLL